MRAILMFCLLIVGLIVGCSTAAPAASPPPTVSATAGTPRPTGGVSSSDEPWPEGFQAPLCEALNGMAGPFAEDFGKVGAALSADEPDFDSIATTAFALKTDVDAIEVALDGVPRWGPATDLVATHRKMLSAWGAVASDLEQGASARDFDLIGRATTRLVTATALLTETTAALEAFLADVPFACE